MRRATRFVCFAIVLFAVAIPLCGQTVNCSSEDGGRHYCNADTRQGVQMVNQRSGSPCTQGVSWDYDGQGIWVDKGCRADFVLTAATLDLSNPINCSSEDGRRHYCRAETRSGVQLIRQRSGSACTKGESWDFDRRGIWVDHGCRADFAVQVEPPRYQQGGGFDGDRKTIYCASDDGGRNYCRAETRAGVQMVRQRSGAECTKGYSWDFDDRGIWVDHGCRADFALETGPDYGSGYNNAYDSNSRSCLRSVGAERANALVSQCLQVSTATHPPCNVQNPCSLINDEIRRGCAILGRDAPRFCDQYR